MRIAFNYKMKISSFLITLFLVSVVIFQNGSIMMKAMKILFVGFSVIYILVIEKRMKWCNYYYWLLLVNIYSAISIAWADSLPFAISSLTTVTINTICLIFFIQLLILQKDLYVTVYRVHAVIPILAFIILFFQHGSIVFEGLREIEDIRYNALGLFAGIGVFFAYMLRSENKIIWTFIISLNIFVVLSTSSRKAMLYLIVPFIIYYFLNAKFTTKTLKYTALIFIGLIGIYYAIMNISFLYKIMGSGIESILNSIFNDSTVLDASLSGRIRRITWGKKWFLERPILGHGIGNFKYLYSNYVDRVTMQIVADNNFIDELVNGGIVGFIIYYSMHLTYIFQTLKYRKSLKSTAIVGFCILVTVFLGDLGSSSYQYLHSQLYLVIAAYSIKQNTEWRINSIVEEKDYEK